jgi:hypothetical protein
MKRIVEPELLDRLPAEDPLARHSRNDLVRLNAWMDNATILSRQLQRLATAPNPRRLLDLGGGDGRFIWQVAKRLPCDWRGTVVELLDKQVDISPEARRGLEHLGWQIRGLQTDVSRFLAETAEDSWSSICANLFLHHFTGAELATLFRLISQRTALFVAVEPRRSVWALIASRMVGLIGCNRVTRHDAVISVRAGFTSDALSALWPKDGVWRLEERRAGFFSHLFVAMKNAPGGDSE